MECIKKHKVSFYYPTVYEATSRILTKCDLTSTLDLPLFSAAIYTNAAISTATRYEWSITDTTNATQTGKQGRKSTAIHLCCITSCLFLFYFILSPTLFFYSFCTTSTRLFWKGNEKATRIISGCSDGCGLM
jgi:hypothetical protein